jgi:hypothetical protein
MVPPFFEFLQEAGAENNHFPFVIFHFSFVIKLKRRDAETQRRKDVKETKWLDKQFL